MYSNRRWVDVGIEHIGLVRLTGKQRLPNVKTLSLYQMRIINVLKHASNENGNRECYKYCLLINFNFIYFSELLGALQPTNQLPTV